MLTVLSVIVFAIAAGFSAFLIWQAAQIHRAIRAREERIFKMELAQVEERERKWEALAESMQTLPERVYAFSHSRVVQIVDKFLTPGAIHTVRKVNPPASITEVPVSMGGKTSPLARRTIFDDESREPGEHEREVASYSESIAAG